MKDATTEQLQNLFQPFGELIGVDVKKNTDGTCRGYGFVTYTSIADANKAISAMNNKQVEGKSLIVVLSDRQQGTTKAEREAQATGGKGAKGKDGKEGKGGDKGKGKSKQPANIANALPAANPPWPYQGEGTYPYGYGYPVGFPNGRLRKPRVCPEHSAGSFASHAGAIHLPGPASSANASLPQWHG